jgi:hypothetical protein
VTCSSFGSRAYGHRARPAGTPQASNKALTERSIRANVEYSVEELANSEALLSHLVEDGS